MKIADTPNPPYFAVIFTIIANDDAAEDIEMARRMNKLAHEQEGFIGMEAAGGKLGIMCSYWHSLNAIREWKKNSEHKLAQESGKSNAFSSFKVRICRVDRDYGFGL